MPHYLISTGCSAAAYFRAEAYLTHAARGFSVYFPKEQSLYVHAGRKAVVSRPFIPGYAFVEQCHRDPAMIRNCPGVVALVYGQGSIRQARHVDELVLELRSREWRPGFLGKPIDLGRAQSFEPGEKVRVISGPFASFSGIFECDSGEQRAQVLLSIFGRQSRCSLGLDQLEVA